MSQADYDVVIDFLKGIGEFFLSFIDSVKGFLGCAVDDDDEPEV